jgi:hypothetical protein
MRKNTGVLCFASLLPTGNTVAGNKLIPGCLLCDARDTLEAVSSSMSLARSMRCANRKSVDV